MKLYFALLLTLASGLLARAASYSFTIFNPTGLTDSTAAGINDGGQIVGLGSNSSGLQGFVYDHGASVVFSAPGATDNITRAVGINNAGVVAGAAIGFDGFSSYPSFGFIYNHGAFTTEALYGPHGGGLFGINDSGELVGRDNLGNPFFRDASGVSHAVNLPKGTARSYFSAINNVGEIGGSYADSSGANHAVLYQNGVVTVLPDRYDQAMAINNVG